MTVALSSPLCSRLWAALCGDPWAPTPAPTGARTPAAFGAMPTTPTWDSGMRRLKRPPSRLRSPEKATRRRTAKATQTSGISFETSRQEKMQDLHQTDGAVTLSDTHSRASSCSMLWCSNSTSGRANKKVEEEEKLLKLFQGISKSHQDTFMQWCEQTLHTLNTANNLDGKDHVCLFVFILFFNDAPLCRFNPSSYVPAVSLHSVPTFASFLKEVESPYEVHDYVRAYLGDTPEAKDFAKQFLERRAKQNANQQKPAQQNQQQALKQQQVRGAEVEPPQHWRTSVLVNSLVSPVMWPDGKTFCPFVWPRNDRDSGAFLPIRAMRPDSCSYLPSLYDSSFASQCRISLKGFHCPFCLLAFMVVMKTWSVKTGHDY